MDWHPFAEKFPRLEGAEYDALKASVERTAGNAAMPIFYRVVSGVMQGLDGRNRDQACRELGLKPTLKKVTVADEDVPDFVLRQNAHRRHLTPASYETIVADMCQEGLSLRAIAAALKLPTSTVGDVASKNKSSGVRRRTNVGDAHEGPILCQRCQRTGPAKDCPACLRKREKADRAVTSRKRPRTKAKVGSVKFDFRPFDSAFGALLRQVDVLGRAFDCKESPDAEGLRASLAEWRQTFKAWHGRVK